MGAASAVMWALFRTVVVKQELSRKAKLPIYQSISIPTLTYGHERWAVTKIMRLRMQADEKSFCPRRNAQEELENIAQERDVWTT